MTDSRRLRDCLGHFGTGVTVVTCHDGEAAHGATVNAFTAVSMDPPLVLVSVDRRSKVCEHLDSGGFVINLLTAQQDEVAFHFAGKPAQRTIKWEEWAGVPCLSDCLAYIRCTPWASYDGGDHVLHVGQVQDHEYRGGEPLLFYRGKFRSIEREVEMLPWLDSLDCPSASWYSSHRDSLTAI